MNHVKHPAGHDIGLGRSALWYGPEVEGPLAARACPTVFVSRRPDPMEYATLCDALRAGTVQHVFLTEEFTNWQWFAVHLLPKLGALPVTVARWADDEDIELVLSQFFAERLRLVVRATVNARWLTRLREQDFVSVGVPYNLSTFAMADGVRTRPEQYTQDKKQP